MTPFVSSPRVEVPPLDDGYTKAHLQIDLTIEGDHLLREIEALEVEKAKVEADLIDAYAALHSVEAQQVATASVHVSTDRVVADEIALATGVGTGEAARRLDLATAPRRHRLVRQAMRDGELSLHRALQVVSETAQLPDADVATVSQCPSARSSRACAGRSRPSTSGVRPSGTTVRAAVAGSSDARPGTGWVP